MTLLYAIVLVASQVVLGATASIDLAGRAVFDLKAYEELDDCQVQSLLLGGRRRLSNGWVLDLRGFRPLRLERVSEDAPLLAIYKHERTRLHFVLIPGTVSWRARPASTGNERDPDLSEGGPTVLPFLVSRFEYTRGAWVLDGEIIELGRGSLFQLREPESGMTWHQADGWCRQQVPSFALPTQLQWDYICRSGGDAPWGAGRDPAFLAHYANLSGRESESLPQEPWSDGYPFIAPVAMYLAGPFGCFDLY